MLEALNIQNTILGYHFEHHNNNEIRHLYYYKNQGCVCVCVLCLCRPPPHWWISFIFYTIIGLDPESGQWLFKLQSYNNNKFYRRNRAKYPRHRYTPQYTCMWDCSKIPVHVSHQIWRDVVCACAACACSCCCLIACHRQCSVRFMILDTVVGFENEMVSAVPVTWVAMKMNWAVQWSEFWAGMRFLDFKLSCIASRRANISWAIRSSSL